MSEVISITNVEASPAAVMPERGLWAAVLERAAQDIHGRDPCCRTGHVIKREALQWLLSHKTGEGSFLYVCELLSWSPSAVRKAIIGRRPFERGPSRIKTVLVADANFPTAGAQRYG